MTLRLFEQSTEFGVVRKYYKHGTGQIRDSLELVEGTTAHEIGHGVHERRRPYLDAWLNV